MSNRSATIEGLRVVFRNPSFGLAEIAWRWAFGGAAWVLLLLGVLEYLHTLPVTTGEMILLRTGHPPLISRALHHIFAGSAARMMGATLALVIGIGALWVIVASFGRAATLRALFQEILNLDVGQNLSIQTLVWIHALRVAVLLGALLSLLSAVIIAQGRSQSHPRIGLAFLLFTFLSVVIAALANLLNWLLSLVPIFAVRDGGRVKHSFVTAMHFIASNFRGVVAANTAFTLIHLAAFTVASSFVFFPFAFAGFLPGWVVSSGVLLLSLLYFAVVDCVYLSRLAAFVSLLKDGSGVEPISLPPRQPATGDDLISEIPGIAPSLPS